MDGTENEHADVDVKGFPTILFFPADAEKQVIPLDSNDRSLKVRRAAAALRCARRVAWCGVAVGWALWCAGVLGWWCGGVLGSWWCVCVCMLGRPHTDIRAPRPRFAVTSVLCLTQHTHTYTHTHTHARTHARTHTTQQALTKFIKKNAKSKCELPKKKGGKKEEEEEGEGKKDEL
jgi:hypothetical protein